jgi:hypothetical protein|tara:strand:+ start:830 stop:1306 length:477 start_codon:yes stop_codon:yes gene_type:complete
MSSKNDWEDFSNMNDFISAKAMIFLSITLALFTQTLAQIVTPSAWLNYQMLAFIMSTNLAAVILAIVAQRSAERISEMQRRAFTPEFYRGTAILASFFSKLEKVSEEKGSSIEDKLDDLAPRVHDFLLSNDPLSVPPEIDLDPVPEWDSEDELFNDDA